MQTSMDQSIEDQTPTASTTTILPIVSSPRISQIEIVEPIKPIRSKRPYTLLWEDPEQLGIHREDYDLIGLYLNRSDPDWLLDHDWLLSPYQKWLLELNRKRINQHPGRLGGSAYKTESTLIAMSDADEQFSVCSCGIPNKRNLSGYCKRKAHCIPCANFRGWKAASRFRYAYERGFWAHITLSWNGYLFIGPDSCDFPTPYWNAAESALRAISKGGYVLGYYSGEHLHLDQLWPNVTINPHVHAIVNAYSADALGEELECILADKMASYVEPVSTKDKPKANAVDNADSPEDCAGNPENALPDQVEDLKQPPCPSTRLKPHVTVKPITDPDHFRNTLKYCTKSPKLSHVYIEDWKRSGALSLSGAEQINSNLQQYYQLLTAAFEKRRTVGFAGNMNPNSKAYIGTRSTKRRRRNQINIEGNNRI